MAIELREAMKSFERRFEALSKRFLAPPGDGFATDVYKRNGDLVVHVDAPGIDPDKDIEVTLSDGDLCVRGERSRREEIKEEDSYRLETSYGSFVRHVPVPRRLEAKDVEANYTDGVLEVVVHGVQAAEESQPAETKATRIAVTRTNGEKPSP